MNGLHDDNKGGSSPSGAAPSFIYRNQEVTT